MMPTTSATKAQIPIGEHRERPTLAADVEQQDACREDRDVDQERLGRQPGVHVGVAGTVDVAVLRVDHGPALQDIAGGLVQRDQCEQHGDVRLDGRPHPRQAALGLNPPVEVVEHQRDGQRHDEDGQRPVHDEGQERQVEDVEPDVLVELGVRDPEVAAVAEEDPVVPLADRPGRADQGQDERQSHVDPSRVRPHELLVAAHQLVLLGEHDVVAGDAVAHDEVHPEDGEEDGAEHAEEAELDHEQRREDVVVADRGEPQAVGVDARQRAQRDQQDDEDDDEADEPPAGAVAAARRGISCQIAGDAHVGSLTSVTAAPTARTRASQQGERLFSRPPAPRGTGSPSARVGASDPSGRSRQY